jgi:hypothetical protein
LIAGGGTVRTHNKLHLKFTSTLILACLSISGFAFQSFTIKSTPLKKQIHLPGLDKEVASLSCSAEKGGDRLLFRSEAPGDAGVLIFETNCEFEMQLAIPGNGSAS